MEYNNVFEVDLAILDAVRQGGGGASGVTPAQVETMINSALTSYSTTQQVSNMIASGTSGLTTTQQVDNQISSALTGYSTTSQVEAMIQASGSTGGGDYVTVTSLTAVTSPTSGMVANVYDPSSSANTTGEWFYDGSAWRPRKIWIERCSVAERVAIYNWIWQRNQGEEPEFNFERQCQVMWVRQDTYPVILTSTGVYTYCGSVINWGGFASSDDQDANRLYVLSLAADGTLSYSNKTLPRIKENVWDQLEIGTDGTVINGNGWWLMQPIEFSYNEYQFGQQYKVIKCEASGQTYYGQIVSFVHLVDETDIGEITGIITIASVPYIGVWGVDGQWATYKKSFTQIA